MAHTQVRNTHNRALVRNGCWNAGTKTRTTNNQTYHSQISWTMFTGASREGGRSLRSSLLLCYRVPLTGVIRTLRTHW